MSNLTTKIRKLQLVYRILNILHLPSATSYIYKQRNSKQMSIDYCGKYLLKIDMCKLLWSVLVQICLPGVISSRLNLKSVKYKMTHLRCNASHTAAKPIIIYPGTVKFRTSMDTANLRQSEQLCRSDHTCLVCIRLPQFLTFVH